MVTQQQRKTALRTEPKAAPSNLTRVSPGIYRDAKGNLVTSTGGSLPGRNNSSKTPTNEPPKQKGAALKRDLTQEKHYRNQTPERQIQEGQMDVGFLGQQIADQATQFDPYNPYARAPEQGYQQAMEAAQQSVMDQFNRRMEPQFQRENQDFQQRMMSQGIDPNSDAYRLQYEQMQQAQNDARLSAQSQGYQLGMQNQQQGWNQYMQGMMLPGQIYQTVQDQWKLPYLSQQEAIQAEKNRQAQLQATRMSSGASVQAAQIQAQAARDNQIMQMMNQYGQQGQKPNYGNAAVGGFTSGVAAGTTNALLR